VLIVSFWFAVAPVHADSFKILGARPLAMGGAFVAVADKSLAQYWNPAGLAVQNGFDVQVPFDAGLEFTGNLLNDANNLSDAANDFSNLQQAQQGTVSKFDAKTLSSYFSGVKNIHDLAQPGKGALVNVNGGVNTRVKKLAVSINNFTSVGVTPHPDLTGIGLGGISLSVPGGQTLNDPSLTSARNTLATVINNSRAAYPNVTGNSTDIATVLINQAATNGSSNQDITNSVNSAAQNEPIVHNAIIAGASGSYANNATNVQFTGASFTEAAVGYGDSFFFLPDFFNDLYWGANLKIISGNVGFYKQNVLQNSTGAFDPVSKLTNDSKSTVKPALDVGLLYDKRKTWGTSFGIVAKNINSPTFDQPSSAASQGVNPVKLNTQVRGGVAYYPTNFWIIATDLDLTKNLTPISGFTSRMWGLGTELNVVNCSWLNIPLRAGIMKNIAESTSDLSYTFGFGLNLLHVVMEVSGAVSSQSVNIKSDSSSSKIPTNLSLGATLSVVF